MPVSPSHNAESMGQTMVGICVACKTETKVKNTLGQWESQCAHPATMYQGTLRKSGRKKIPNIPSAAELMHVKPTAIDTTKLETHSAEYAEKLGIDQLGQPVEPVRGMIDPNEPRDDEVAAAQAQPVVPGDPTSFNVEASMKVIALHARGMARALLTSQKRIRELELLLVDESGESAKLRQRIEELEGERDAVAPEPNDEEPDDEFDPDDMPF